jgi:DNA-binding IclR family transcriptional regulator
VFESDETALSTHRLKVMIVGTFREMPGMRLNVSQAVRLFGVAPATCRALLEDLVRSGELCKARDGHYRLDSEHRF